MLIRNLNRQTIWNKQTRKLSCNSFQARDIVWDVINAARVYIFMLTVAASHNYVTYSCLIFSSVRVFLDIYCHWATSRHDTAAKFTSICIGWRLLAVSDEPIPFQTYYSRRCSEQHLLKYNTQKAGLRSLTITCYIHSFIHLFLIQAAWHIYTEYTLLQ